MIGMVIVGACLLAVSVLYSVESSMNVARNHSEIAHIKMCAQIACRYFSS